MSKPEARRAGSFERVSKRKADNGVLVDIGDRLTAVQQNHNERRGTPIEQSLDKMEEIRSVIKAAVTGSA